MTTAPPVASTPHVAGMPRSRLTSSATRLWRGAAGDPAWARPALLGLLAATALLYFWNLTANGYANSFYSAAAQAGSASWKAFFYGSFDAGNAITVDKPPASLWAMALSVRVFGLNSFAILLPEVLMGLGTVAVLYATVKRQFGAAAGLIAGAVLALTPVAVLMFRFNNPEALLVLLMTLAAWATMRAIESGSPRWMALAGVFIGFGFLTKALQVLLVVPFLGLAFLICADTTLRRRVIGAVAGVGAMVASAGWWVAIVELVPAASRPYIGGSQTNSFLELTFGYNGFGRLNGEEVGSVGQRGPNSGGGTIWRMFETNVGGQISWLLPSALILLIAGLALRGRMPRTDARRAAYVVWGGWLLVTMLTFSMMAGIFHEYYTVALAPAIAALVGMGAVEAWEQRERWAGALTLAAAMAAAAVWSFVLLTRTTAYSEGLRIGIVAVGIAAAGLFVAISRLDRRAVPVLVGASLAVALAGPAAFSATTVTTAKSGSIVTAGPRTAGGFGMPGGGQFPGGSLPGGGQFPGGGLPGGSQFPGGGLPGGGLPGGGTAGQPTFPGGLPGGPPLGGPTGAPGGGMGGGMGGLLNATVPSSEVVSALSKDAASYRWVAAAVGSQNAAGLQLATGDPVMSIGGFNGSDPAPTLEQFKSYVAAGDIHYFLAGGGFGGQNGGSNASSEISTWVSTTFSPVTIGGQTFYDLTTAVGEAS